jgi:hypothetical protein
MLIFMTIDHLPSAVSKITYEFVGYVSAAEGFVFLSGFVAGLTYTRFSLISNGARVATRAFSRAKTIYVYHMLTFLVLYFTLWGFKLDQEYWSTWINLYHLSIWRAILTAATFLQQPKFLDVLPMYCLFLVVTPWIIRNFLSQRASLVFAFSAALWLFSQCTVWDQVVIKLQRHAAVFFGEFNVFAWQALFIGGLYLGHLAFTHSMPTRPPSRVVTYYAILVALGLFLFRHHIIPDQNLNEVMDRLAGKRNLSIVRIINFMTIVFLLGLTLPWIKQGPFIKALAYLGRQSLQVFAVQTILVSYVQILVTQGGVWSEFARLGLVIISIATLYVVAWYFERRRRTSEFEYSRKETEVNVKLLH